MAVLSLNACAEQILSCEDTSSCVDATAHGGNGGESNQDEEDDEHTSGKTRDEAEACPEGSWDHDKDADTACKDWTECARGERVDEEGTSATDRTCMSCEEGTYSEKKNAKLCTAWTECPSGVVQAGTTTEDQICDSPAIDVAVGGDFSCILREDDRVACWGNNQLGQLGNGGTKQGLFPAPVMVEGKSGREELTGVVQLSAGIDFACALRDDTSVWCWGANHAGQLGTGTYEEGDFVPYAVEVEGVPSVSHLDIGGNYACAVLEDQTARCWGGGGGTQWALGGGEEQSNRRIVTVVSPSGEGALEGIVRIAAGGPHTCAVTEQGRAYCWGYAIYGEVPGTFGGSELPVLVESDIDFVDAATGEYESCFLGDDGQVGCLGAGPFGSDSTENRELAHMPVSKDSQGKSLPLVVDIELDRSVRCMLFEDGSMRCWGANDYGQLGDGSTNGSFGLVEVKGLEDVVAMDAAFGRACAVQDNGRVLCWGNTPNCEKPNGNLCQSAEPLPVPHVEQAVELVSGSHHTCALLETGKVTCWGSNSHGQLGLGGELWQSGPVELTGISDVTALGAKAIVTLATKKDHTVRYWGYGLGGTLSSSIIKNVTDLEDVISVGAGADHACAVHENGKLSCWGGNDCSQAGPDGGQVDPVTAPTLVDALSGVEAFSGGAAHSCVIMTGDVWCWGGHGFGEAGGASTCGAASFAERVADNVQQIASGYGHTVALTDDGEVVAWGMNDDGQLGYAVPSTPPTSSQALPVDDVGPAIAVMAGEMHSCAVLESGRAMCWGQNGDGQLGRAEVSDFEVNAELVSGLTGVVKMSAGLAHTCALHEDGTVSCWGDNHSFQLGNDPSPSLPREVVWSAPTTM